MVIWAGVMHNTDSWSYTWVDGQDDVMGKSDHVVQDDVMGKSDHVVQDDVMGKSDHVVQDDVMGESDHVAHDNVMGKSDHVVQHVGGRRHHPKCQFN